MFNNKRGISPLIATILLIAFAVSIGALIMNWSSSVENTAPKLIKTSTCAVVDIQVLSACQNDQEIVLSLKNIGAETVNKILLKSGNFQYIIDSSFVSSAENKVFHISKDAFNFESFQIIPVILSEGNELVCTNSAYKDVSLVNC